MRLKPPTLAIARDATGHGRPNRRHLGEAARCQAPQPLLTIGRRPRESGASLAAMTITCAVDQRIKRLKLERQAAAA